MSTRSVFFAAILSVAACQRDIVSIQQRRLPFQNGTLRDVFRTRAGTLKHIQTLQIQNAVGPRSQFDEISSIIVNSDGSQLLAINDDAVWVSLILTLFFTIRLEKTFGDQFDVSEAVLYPMRDPDGESIPFEPRDGNPRGLTIDGAYPGEGRGELFVGFGSGRRLLKFPVGVRSLTSAEVDISVLLDECGFGPQVINKMRPNRLRPGYLMICDEPTTDDYRVFPGYAYHGDRPKRFTVERSIRLPEVYIRWNVFAPHNCSSYSFELSVLIQSDDDFFPADMAGLSNGDVMILFTTTDYKMRIGFVTAKDLSLAMRRDETVVPQIILEAAESDGFNVGRQSGLAIREDSDNRVFVYTTSESRSGGRPTLLTAFEWIA